MNGVPGAPQQGHAAIYPGSFDPMTRGHLDVIERAAAIFDKVVVAVVVNPQKREPLFTLAEREKMISASVAHLPNVEVTHFRGLLADFVRGTGATVIVKGLRVVSDFESEMSTALMNRSLSAVDTVFLPSDPRWSFVSSTLVKEVYSLGADVAEYVPPAVLQVMQAKRPAPRPAERS
ncbi:MAG TPA: pantetheine-phosphate adenylyltransferase [Candidatus Elarobacter sp.]|nr:pantetheine-phosphate adenylyltransferase [Candidatus Elarobacter sp.]